MRSERDSVESAKRAVYVLFFCFGIVYITFLSRLVEIRELLGGITPGEASLILLCLSLGSTAVTPIGGALLERVSIRKVVRIFGALCAVMLVIMSFLATSANYAGCLVCAVLMGACNGMSNVANNVAGVAVEKRGGGKSMMPRFHSFFQIGAVCATLVSQFWAFFAFDFRLQCILASAVAIMSTNLVASRLYTSTNIDTSAAISEAAVESDGVLINPSLKDKLHAKGLDLNLMLVGLIILASTLTEGTGNDWISQGVVETFETPEAVGLFSMWTYLLVTAVTRFFGGNILDRLGRVLAMRISFASALFGVTFFIFTPFMFGTIIAAVFWGFGVALGYPVCITVASESKHHAAFRASVVASMGTVMNIAGPPIIGILANVISIRYSLIVLLPGLIIGFLAIHALKHRDGSPMKE
ncbi:MAG: MFS transporter [Candidatus Ancillula sp.]|jgi:MFS family permease|nr:MFS transporter [Candidatus Ancillula sp.]